MKNKIWYFLFFINCLVNELQSQINMGGILAPTAKTVKQNFPDLIFANIVFDSVYVGYLSIAGTVKNIGTAGVDLDKIRYNIYLIPKKNKKDDAPKKEWLIANNYALRATNDSSTRTIEPGVSSGYGFRWPLFEYSILAGYAQVKIVLDPRGAIRELNENNNTYIVNMPTH